jgi:hypothetical protein
MTVLHVAWCTAPTCRFGCPLLAKTSGLLRTDQSNQPKSTQHTIQAFCVPGLPSKVLKECIRLKRLCMPAADAAQVRRWPCVAYDGSSCSLLDA